MTLEQTLEIMAILSAYYGNPKADETTMAKAWHVTMGEYEYEYAVMAVHVFARKDKRDYASFPTLGNIVEEIENIQKAPHRIFGKMRKRMEYKDLEQEERWLITEKAYNRALEKDDEELIDDHKVIIEFIKGNAQKQLKGEK